MLVLYGSETGTAEEMAERVANIASKKGMHGEVVLKAMNESSLTELTQTKVAIFICSTTGNGEAPRNMQHFWRELLQRNLSSDCLAGLKFAVFGLGDSSYEKFCVVGKRLHRRMLALGATAMIERVDGDEQHPHGLDGAFLPWLTTLWPRWRELALEPRTSLASPSACSVYNPVKVSLNQRLTPADYWQDVRLISFETPFHYEAGDVVQLVPENDPQEVQRILDLLHWDGDARLKVGLRVPAHLPRIPEDVTVRQLLIFWLDLNRPPSRRFLEIMARKANLDEQHRERLLELGTRPESYDEYLDYVWRPKRRPSEVLADLLCSNLNISNDWIFDLFPWIRPRLFSIASYAPGKIELLVALVRYRTILKEDRVGLCSQWLARTQTIPRHSIVPGSMRLPADPETPILLLCAGTGLAPMRSMIQAIAKRSSITGVCLVYGFRRQDADFLCRKELESIPWLKIIAHGSRDQPEKIYIQHLIRENAELIVDLIAAGCFVYVSGSTKLPRVVKRALADCLSAPDVDFLEAEGRLQIEAWN